MSCACHLCRPSVDPLCDLLDTMLSDALFPQITAETARAVRALRHAAEYAVMAAEMLMEGDRSGRMVTPEQALSWATIRLAEVWDGETIGAPIALEY